MRRTWEMEHKMLIMILHDILLNMIKGNNFRSNNEDRINRKDHNTFYVNNEDCDNISDNNLLAS